MLSVLFEENGGVVTKCVLLLAKLSKIYPAQGVSCSTHPLLLSCNDIALDGPDSVNVSGLGVSLLMASCGVVKMEWLDGIRFLLVEPA